VRHKVSNYSGINLHSKLKSGRFSEFSLIRRDTDSGLEVDSRIASPFFKFHIFLNLNFAFRQYLIPKFRDE